MLYPMLLEAPLKDYLWGGTRLKTKYGKKTELNKVAESWELSCHKDGKALSPMVRLPGRRWRAGWTSRERACSARERKRFRIFPC